MGSYNKQLKLPAWWLMDGDTLVATVRAEDKQFARLKNS